MVQPVPNTIDFKEKGDEPIGEMEKLIAETIAQRNFEINQLQNPNKEEAEKWLQSVKTSSSKEDPTGIKYIKIGEPISNKPEPIVELPSPKKQLSWAPQLEEDDDNNIQLNVSDSIFSKLKPLKDSNLDIKTLNGKMDTLIDKMDILIDLFTKNANK